MSKETKSAGKSYTAKKKLAPVLEDGRHLLKVIGISETEAKNDEKTPQIEAILQAANGIKQTYWMSLVGYKKDGDEYITDKNGMRIEDEDNSEIAQGIFLDFAVNCGIDDGADFALEDLLDAEVGVNIMTNAAGYKRVQYSVAAEQVGEESLF